MEAQKIEVGTLYETWINDPSIKLDKKDFFQKVDEYIALQEKEICGKCVPCRDGIPHIRTLFKEIGEGKGTDEKVIELETLIRNLRSSRCTIGLSVGKNLEIILENNFELLAPNKEGKDGK